MGNLITHLSLAGPGFGRPTPCCAVVTPTRSGDLWSMAVRFVDAVRRALPAWGAGFRRATEELSLVDPSTLRDLGISHRAVLDEPVDPLAEKRLLRSRF